MEQQEHPMTILEFISSLAWPLVILFVLLRYHVFVKSFLEKLRSVKLIAFGQEIELSAQEAKAALEELAEDVISLVSDISEEERQLYVRIRALQGGKSVKEVLPEFKRGNHQHQLLQALRDRKLIRPLEGSSWQDEKHPVVTRFSQLVERIYPDLLRPRSPNKALQPMARENARPG